MSNKIYPFDLDASALIFLAYTYHASNFTWGWHSNRERSYMHR